MMNISHKPSAFISESVAPIRGASISECCRGDELFMGTAPEQLLRVLIKVAQRVMNGVDHRS
ncbi:hypothetical protein D3C87_1788020 [compost metagenome]